jgi:hypothetical protein
MHYEKQEDGQYALIDRKGRALFVAQHIGFAYVETSHGNLLLHHGPEPDIRRWVDDYRQRTRRVSQGRPINKMGVQSTRELALEEIDPNFDVAAYSGNVITQYPAPENGNENSPSPG